MKRRSLESDPEKVRAWQQRSNGFKRKAKIPPGIRATVFGRSEGLCVVCVYRLRRQGLPLTAACRAVQLHHVLCERDYPEFAKVADNLIGCCPTDHARHEAALPRIPRAALPAYSIAFAEAQGLGWYIESTYPA